MKSPLPVRLCLLLTGPCLFSLSCTSPAPPSGFLTETALMKKDPSVPFQSFYLRPGTDFSKYWQVYLPPTRTDKVKVNQRFLGERRAFIKSWQDDADRSGKDLRDSFVAGFQASRPREWKVLESPARTRETLVLETNLVEISPSRPLVQAAGFLVPGVSVINRVTVAMEARLSEARTGKTLAAWADREATPFSPVDLAKFRFYRSQRNLMRQWGRQTVQWLNRLDDRPIRDPLPFRPITW